MAKIDDKTLIAMLRQSNIEKQEKIQRLEQELSLALASRQLSPVRKVTLPMVKPPVADDPNRAKA